MNYIEEPFSEAELKKVVLGLPEEKLKKARWFHDLHL
jgi:hypothetical protein